MGGKSGTFPMAGGVVVMAGKKEQPRPQYEEIEWTDEDDAIMDKVYAELRPKA